jgi:hypothetical protein
MTRPGMPRRTTAARAMTRPDRAAVALGAASLVSVVFTFTNGDPWQMVAVPAPAVAVALVLGAAACLGGLFSRALVVRAAGGAFLLAALVVLLELALATDWTEGDASTMSLWAGLGMGLLAAGFAPRDT